MIRAAGIVGAVFEPEALFGFAHDCRRQTAQPCDVVAERPRCDRNIAEQVLCRIPGALHDLGEWPLPACAGL